MGFQIPDYGPIRQGLFSGFMTGSNELARLLPWGKWLWEWIDQPAAEDPKEAEIRRKEESLADWRDWKNYYATREEEQYQESSARFYGRAFKDITKEYERERELWNIWQLYGADDRLRDLALEIGTDLREWWTSLEIVQPIKRMVHGINAILANYTRPLYNWMEAIYTIAPIEMKPFWIGMTADEAWALYEAPVEKWFPGVIPSAIRAFDPFGVEYDAWRIISGMPPWKKWEKKVREVEEKAEQIKKKNGQEGRLLIRYMFQKSLGA